MQSLGLIKEKCNKFSGIPVGKLQRDKFGFMDYYISAISHKLFWYREYRRMEICKNCYLGKMD